MVASNTLMTVFVVMLVAGGGVAAAGVASTDTDASPTSMTDLEMDATLDGETLAVSVTDDGSPVENATVTVDGEEDVTVSTDANGTATVNLSALTDDDETLGELEVEYESEYVEGKLEFVVQDSSLTLLEESYEYDVEYDDDEDGESEDVESEDDEMDEESSEEAKSPDEDDADDENEEEDDESEEEDDESDEDDDDEADN